MGEGVLFYVEWAAVGTHDIRGGSRILSRGWADFQKEIENFDDLFF